MKRKSNPAGKLTAKTRRVSGASDGNTSSKQVKSKGVGSAKATKLKAAALPSLAIILLIVVTLEFSSSKLKPVRDEVSRTTQQVEMIRKQALQGQAVLANPEVTDAESKSALEKMPSEPELAEVIAQVDRLARESNLTWTAGAPAPAPVTDSTLPTTIRAWSMGVTFTGSVSGLYKFIDNLDSINRVVTMETLSMQQSGGVYTATAVLRFYAMGA